MRHKVAGRRLGRTTSHRKADFQNMTVSLIEHELIRTTVAKAKELRRFAEPLITRAKDDSLANRRLTFDRLRDRKTVQKLFSEIGPRYASRPVWLSAEFCAAASALATAHRWHTSSWSIGQ